MEETMKSLKKRIMVIDDEPSLTRLIRINLQQTGEYEVLEENRPDHALAAARDFGPDLILLDVVMPGLDGGFLASQFQASPHFAKVPIIFLTAAVTPQEVTARGGYVGGLPFLAKPVDMPELVDRLHHHLGTGAAAPSQVDA
jgi:DNA-binding response OmpR family regulator